MLQHPTSFTLSYTHRLHLNSKVSFLSPPCIALKQYCNNSWRNVVSDFRPQRSPFNASWLFSSCSRIDNAS